jgi:hypothetical protein
MPAALLFAIAAVAAVWAAGLLQDLLLGAGAIAPEQKVWLLDADSEESVLTWMSTLLLFACAGALYVVSTQARDLWLRLSWTALTLIFLLLSADEMLSLHEKLADIVKGEGVGGGVFHFAWVAVALPLVAVLGLAFLPLLRAIRPAMRNWMVLAAMVYLGGAVGTEMVAGPVVERFGQLSFAYRLLANLEEGLECAGLLIFLTTLVAYVRSGQAAVAQAPNVKADRARAARSRAAA